LRLLPDASAFRGFKIKQGIKRALTVAPLSPQLVQVEFWKEFPQFQWTGKRLFWHGFSAFVLVYFCLRVRKMPSTRA
jgi:hypothetical protein